MTRTCARCGHPQDWHRLDDSLNLDPTDPATPFRCIGHDCESPGPIRACSKACPDFLGWDADRFRWPVDWPKA